MEIFSFFENEVVPSNCDSYNITLIYFFLAFLFFGSMLPIISFLFVRFETWFPDFKVFPRVAAKAKTPRNSGCC